MLARKDIYARIYTGLELFWASEDQLPFRAPPCQRCGNIIKDYRKAWANVEKSEKCGKIFRYLEIPGKVLKSLTKSNKVWKIWESVEKYVDSWELWESMQKVWKITEND